MTKFHGDLTEEKFFVGWFGLIGGREIGTTKENLHRKFTEDIDEYLTHIKMCMDENLPCWITSQPMRAYQQPMAIEKLFFDFDDDSRWCSQCDTYTKKDDLSFEIVDGKKRKNLCPKCKIVCIDKPRTQLIANEVTKFIENAEAICKSQAEPFIPIPFIVKTYKGFHVYYFLTEVFQFQPSFTEKAKELYDLMERKLIGNASAYQFMDTLIIGDLMRMARIPLTTHEKSGELCEILDSNLRPTKVRSLEYYKTYGIPTSFVKKAIKIMKARMAKEYQKEKLIIKEFGKDVNNGSGMEFGCGIRPCFKARMEKGEATHAMRLAWLAEIYYNGYNTPEKMMELCRQTWHDFSEKISRQQIDDYFKHKRFLYHPYKCKTIREKGWCLGMDVCKKERDVENTNK